MTLLSPLALVWFASVPVLLWLWRLASTRHQVRIPSLIPFERLLERPSRRRTRLVVNLLFWLQLAALLLLVVALAQPVWFSRRANTLLVVLDTSASMAASRRGASAFEHATRALLERIARKSPTEQLFIVTSAPIAAVTPQPISDATTLTNVVRSLRVSHVSGSLATAARLGLSQLATTPEAMLVLTDEPKPAEGMLPTTRWVTVGAAMPNVAIVGLDTQGSFCHTEQARLVVTIHNFSDEAASVRLDAKQAARSVAHASAELAAGARQAVSMELAEGTTGWIEILLSGGRDALDLDNHAWVEIRPAGSRPIVVRSTSASLTETMSKWLAACPALTWSAHEPLDGRPAVVITDQSAGSPAASLMQFFPPHDATPVLSEWVVSADHPIGSYLAPIERVAAALDVAEGLAPSGTPVVSAILNGRHVPIVLADERDGRRVVSMLFDPIGREDSTPMLLAFFNSLRWLMGDEAPPETGQPLVFSGFAPGGVTIHRPDGSSEAIESDGAEVRYEATTLAGRYQATQGSTTVTEAVNCLNPLESNLIDRRSTWRPLSLPASTTQRPTTTRHPLANLLLLAALILLLLEWSRYTELAPGSRLQAPGHSYAPPASGLPGSTSIRAGEKHLVST